MSSIRSIPLGEENDGEENIRSIDLPPEKKEESLEESFGLAIPRLMIDSGMGLLKLGSSIPSYTQKATTEIPGLMKMLISPSNITPHTLMQGLAGSQELINSLAQMPKGIASYGEKRLHLLPKGSEEAVAKFSPDDTTQAISQLFGEPEKSGEALFRGLTRNADLLMGAATLPKVLQKISKKLPAKMSSDLVLDSMKDISNEFKQGLKLQHESYNKFFPKYGKDITSVTPEKFLGLSKKEIDDLYTHSRTAYDNYIKSPTVNNLHEFQKKVGHDAYTTEIEAHRQLFRDIRNRSQNKLIRFAETRNDKEALNGLMNGIKITRDVVSPFEVNKTIRKIAKGNIKPGARNLDELIQAIKDANEAGENVINPMTGNPEMNIRGVPEDHYLKTLQKLLEEKSDFINSRAKKLNRLGKWATLGTGYASFELLKDIIAKHTTKH